MELSWAIKTRRSIRNFKSEDIDDAIVNDIIEAGRYAPTGGNAQNTGYIILGTKQEAADLTGRCLIRKIKKLTTTKHLVII